jgi:hypothetical protein
LQKDSVLFLLACNRTFYKDRFIRFH